MVIEIYWEILNKRDGKMIDSIHLEPGILPDLEPWEMAYRPDTREFLL